MEFAHERLPAYRATVGFVAALADALARAPAESHVLVARAQSVAVELALAIARGADATAREIRTTEFDGAASYASQCCVLLDLLLRARAISENDHATLRDRLLRLARALTAQGNAGVAASPESIAPSRAERRDSARFSVLFPMKVDVIGGTDGVAISRDVGRNGVLMATALELAPGSPISVTFQVDGRDEAPRVVRGRIVRVNVNREDAEGLWPYEVAVVFDTPVPEIEPLLGNPFARSTTAETELPDEPA